MLLSLGITTTRTVPEQRRVEKRSGTVDQPGRRETWLGNELVISVTVDPIQLKRAPALALQKISFIEILDLYF